VNTRTAKGQRRRSRINEQESFKGGFMAKKQDNEREEKIKQIISLMDLMLEDMSVPRNVKKSVEDAKKRLLEKGDPTVRAGAAVYYLEEMSEDINLPPHARTQIWQILSALESICNQ
jgi:Uncharacterized protein conserved in archaea